MLKTWTYSDNPFAKQKYTNKILNICAWNAYKSNTQLVYAYNVHMAWKAKYVTGKPNLYWKYEDTCGKKNKHLLSKDGKQFCLTPPKN